MIEIQEEHRHLLFNEPIVSAILNRLRQGLDPGLTYHSAAHTVDVLDQTLKLAAIDSVNSHSTLLLAIAAAFHDAGFLEQRADHEQISASMAAEAMRDDPRFAPKDIELVRAMIMDTQIRPDGPMHHCSTPLSPWLLDADLANFGRADFFKQTDLVAKENHIEPEDALLSAIKLMDRHSWLSKAGIACFAEKKSENRQLLTLRLS